MADILDPLTRLADAPPALNATTDMPQPEPTVPPENQPELTPPAPAEQAPRAPEPAPKPSVNERFSDLARQRREAEARAAAADQRLEKALAALERAMAPPPPPASPPPAEEPQPTREGFDTPEAYDRALIAWSGRIAGLEAARVAQAEWQRQAEAQRQADAERQANEAQQRTQNEIVESWIQRRAEALKKYPDFSDVAESGDVKISLAMRDALFALDDGPEVAYHLGKNPDEAERISKLMPIRQVAEIGRIAAQLAAPTPAPPPPPPPINPLRGGNSSPSLSPEEDPGYMDRRLAELRQQRTPGNIGMVKQ